jgi:hypothetical protein
MEGLDYANIVVWRAVERLIGVLIGGGAIYLGYLLFMALPQRSSDSEGKFDLPGGISIYVSRVGPGVFFALFGTALVGMSFANAMRFDSGAVAPAPAQVAAASDPAPAAAQASFSYVTGEAEGAQANLERDAVVRDARTLRRWETALNGFATTGALPLERADADSLLIALPRIKRMMLHGVWDPDWGSYDDFAEWVRNGAAGAPPPGLDDKVAAIFRPAE